MRLLLDTHVFIWWRVNSPRLGASARQAIATAEVVYVSVVSAWEASVKISLGKLEIPGPLEEAVDDSGFSKLFLTFEHAWSLKDLPAHHRDPFDRMLVVQVLVERLTIVTADPKFELYGVDLIRA